MTGSSSRGKRSPRQPRLQEPDPRHLWMRECDSSTHFECQTAGALQARQRGRNLRTPSSRAKARALQPRHPGPHLLRTEELVQVPHPQGAKATNAQTLSRGHRTHGARALGGNKPILHLGAHLGASTLFFLLQGLQCPTFLPLAALDRFRSLVQNNRITPSASVSDTRGNARSYPHNIQIMR